MDRGREPTSALGVEQAAIVLRCTTWARDRGVGVVLITQDPHHAPSSPASWGDPRLRKDAASPQGHPYG
jgi:hypothetical protein